MRRRILLTLSFFIVLAHMLSANDTIYIDESQYHIDIDIKLVISNVDVDLVNENINEITSYIHLDNTYELSSAVTQIELGVAYQISSNTGSTYSLYFTELPIIKITSNAQIVDEPNVPAFFTMIESNGNITQSDIGIQLRGGWTQTLPKKSMEIEFWTDPQESDQQDIALLGMRDDDDWNLLAMYNEPLRIRNVTNFKLWQMISELHYQADEPNAKNTVSLHYVELILNDSYQGIYALGEKIDRKQLKLKSHNGNIRGELYKGISWGATTLGSLPLFDNNSEEWGGFEYKHPSEEINWTNLYDFVEFVINANDEKFYEEIENRFELDNLVNYFIFINTLRAVDNLGKNIYLAKYTTDDPYFYVPWDLDGTFGTAWHGGNDPEYDDILLNGMYERLMNEPCLNGGFREALKERWETLRLTTLSDDSLIALLSANHNLLLQNGVYERESLVWSDYTYNSSAFDYMTTWIHNRTPYLDSKFSEECLVSTENDYFKSNFWIGPNPVVDFLNITSNIDKTLQVAIYNNVGQILMNLELNGSNNSISLEGLQSGLYTISLTAEDKIKVYRILVK